MHSATPQLFIAALGLAATPASAAQMRPGSGPTHATQIPLSCKLLDGAATSAPDGVAFGPIQQILVRSEGVTRQGILARAFVHLRSGRIVDADLSAPTKLVAGQWVRVGEITSGTSCTAMLFARSPGEATLFHP